MCECKPDTALEPVEDHLQLVRDMIMAIGDDPDREGLLNTPRRVVKAWKELFAGYGQDPKQFSTAFSEGYDQVIVCRGIEFFSFCEHHMLPFYGTVSIGYIPSPGDEGKPGKVIGLSKLARITDVFAKRLQIQERLTEQIGEALQGIIDPLGVAVVVEGVHTCMTMRGANKQRSTMVTSSMRGIFRDSVPARAEVMGLLKNG